ELRQFGLFASSTEADDQMVESGLVVGVGLQCEARGRLRKSRVSGAQIEFREDILCEGELGFAAHGTLRGSLCFLKRRRAGLRTLPDEEFGKKIVEGRISGRFRETQPHDP